MTEFRKLAKRVAKDIEGTKSTSYFGEYYLCENLPIEESQYIKKYFKPDAIEMADYRMNDCAWLSKFFSHASDNNSFRILILLFAEQHYLHYLKIDDDN